MEYGDQDGAKDAFTALQQDVQDIRSKIIETGLTHSWATAPKDRRYRIPHKSVLETVVL